MSDLQSGAVLVFGLLKFPPEGAWCFCGGAAGLVFPLAGLRAGPCLTELLSLSLPQRGDFNRVEDSWEVFHPSYTHALADTETNHFSSGVWGKRRQKVAQRTKSKLAF